MMKGFFFWNEKVKGFKTGEVLGRRGAETMDEE